MLNWKPEQFDHLNKRRAASGLLNCLNDKETEVVDKTEEPEEASAAERQGSKLPLLSAVFRSLLAVFVPFDSPASKYKTTNCIMKDSQVSEWQRSRIKVH